MRGFVCAFALVSLGVRVRVRVSARARVCASVRVRTCMKALTRSRAVFFSFCFPAPYLKRRFSFKSLDIILEQQTIKSLKKTWVGVIG